MTEHIAYAHHHHGTISPFGCYMELRDGECVLGAAVPCPLTHAAIEYGVWQAVADVPIPTDLDAWIVTARRATDRDFMSGMDVTYTTVRAHLPGAYHAGVPPDRPRSEDAVQPDAWLRIPPPPWLEGK